MKFTDFYRTGPPAISLEIFPPKNEAGLVSLLEALSDLKSFHPAFISVTYGAMGSTQDRTRDLAIRIRGELGLETAFHFTCVGSDRNSIRHYVTSLQKEGLSLIVALRGDPPEGSEKFVKPKDGFSYANELVEFLRKIGGFSIAVAGYPEGHIEAKDPETDLKNLVKKVEAGADIVITQLFFENEDFFRFEERAQGAGIKVPIIPGIMPIINLNQIEKIARMCGAKIPKRLLHELNQNEGSPDAIIKIGIDHALTQCRGLLRHGAPGIHFYTLNKSHSVRRILEGLACE